MSTTSTKQARTTIQQAPYYLARRLPFVAGNGSLSGRISQDSEGSHFLVYSGGDLIAWSINGDRFIVPYSGEGWRATQRRHQGIVRQVNESTVTA